MWPAVTAAAAGCLLPAAGCRLATVAHLYSRLVQDLALRKILDTSFEQLQRREQDLRWLVSNPYWLAAPLEPLFRGLNWSCAEVRRVRYAARSGSSYGGTAPLDTRFARTTRAPSPMLRVLGSTPPDPQRMALRTWRVPPARAAAHSIRPQPTLCCPAPQVVYLLYSVLTDQKVLFASADPSVLAPCAQALRSLM